MSAPIVLGFDGSEQSLAALVEATRIAAQTDSDVEVVFAYYISPLGGGDVADYKAGLERVAQEQTATAVERLTAAGVKATAWHVSGKPADAILEVAEQSGARMIVVGSSTQSALAAAILGSVVINLVQRSAVPLLVVPA